MRKIQNHPSKKQAVPSVTIRFDEPELAEVYTAIKEQGKPADRLPHAQVRHILKEWAKQQGALT